MTSQMFPFSSRYMQMPLSEGRRCETGAAGIMSPCAACIGDGAGSNSCGDARGPRARFGGGGGGSEAFGSSFWRRPRFLYARFVPCAVAASTDAIDACASPAVAFAALFTTTLERLAPAFACDCLRLSPSLFASS